VLKARWEMGYEYCTNPICVRKLGQVKVSLYEQPPKSDEMADLSPLDLDDVAAIYDADPDD